MAAIEAKRRDRPIYLQVESHRGIGKYLWYVIEEKSSKQEDGGKRIKRQKKMTEEEEDGIDMKLESETDRIRKLRLPEVNRQKLRFNSLVVFNSRLYLVGGVEIEYGEGCSSISKPVSGYQYLDMAERRPRWRRRCNDDDDFKGEDQSGATLCEDDDGSIYIYTVGRRIMHRFHPYPHGPINTNTTDIRRRSRNCLPNYPDDHRGPPPFLLASTKDKLYAYSSETGKDFSNTMICYDFKSNEWDVLLDTNFWGEWSQGVVLYMGAHGDANNAYLLSFGTQNPKEEDDFGYGGVPAVYAFHLRTREWLDAPVAGLPNDGIVLPDEEEARESSFTRYLLQIDDHDHHKLALVWSWTYLNELKKTGEEIHWSKFIVNPLKHRITSTQPHPEFHAKLLSNGVCHLEQDTIKLRNCSSGLEIGPEKGNGRC